MGNRQGLGFPAGLSHIEAIVLTFPRPLAFPVIPYHEGKGDYRDRRSDLHPYCLAAAAALS